MLLTEVRRGRGGPPSAEQARAGAHDHMAMATPTTHEHAHDDGEAHDHAHEHPHAAATPHDHGPAVVDDGLEHSPRRRPPSPRAPAGSTISWRSLFVLGLAGGLVPSASALLILLATIAAGRPAWGVVLVAAFGLGMAAVDDRRRPRLRPRPRRCWSARRRGSARRAPSAWSRAGAAVLVLMVGVVLTTQALAVVGLGLGTSRARRCQASERLRSSPYGAAARTSLPSGQCAI